MNKTTKQAYRPAEAAVYLGISLSTFWLYVKRGRLVTTKISDRVTIVSREQLDKLLGGEI